MTVTVTADGQLPVLRRLEVRIVSVQGQDGTPVLANEDREESFTIGGRHRTFQVASRIVNEVLAFDAQALACD